MTTQPPDWWTSLPDDVDRALRNLPGVSAFTIGFSAGGRDIRAYAFGEPDHLPGRTSNSLASSRGANDVTTFYGQGVRTRQHVLFVGATHGTEFEGTVAMASAFHAVITGKDLRGRPQPALHAMKDQFRIVFVPFFNMDGRMRYADLRTFLPFDRDGYDEITMGKMTDGTLLRWPACKAHAPQPPEQFVNLGSYFNDAGVNLVYDDFFGDPQPETRALMTLCRDEMPDVICLSHTNHGSLIEHASSFVPRTFQLRLAQLSGAVAQRVAAAGFPPRIVNNPDPYCGQVFYHTDALHHHCGALPVLMEFPGGLKEPVHTHEAVFDLCLFAIEETFNFGANHGFRPPRF